MLSNKNINKLVIGVIIILFSLCLVLSCYQYSSSENKSLLDAITIFVTSLGGASVIFTIFFNSINDFKNRQSKKIENTFSLLTKWDDTHLLEARKFTRKIKAKADSLSKRELIERIEEDEPLKQSVLLVLNYLEHVRFSILTDRIDNHLFYKSLGPTLTAIIDRFLPYAEHIGKLFLEDLNHLKNELEKINLEIRKLERNK
jgi:hypothetical protein